MSEMNSVSDHPKQMLSNMMKMLTAEAGKIKDALQEEAAYSSDVFSKIISVTYPNEPNDFEKELQVLRGEHGVYVFIICDKVIFDTKAIQKWNSVKQAKIDFTKPGQLQKGDCLYVGSCYSKSLFSRMKEHFTEFHNCGLQLGCSQRSILRSKVTAFCFPMKREYSEMQMKIVLPIVEKQLHIIAPPFTGSSRT